MVIIIDICLLLLFSGSVAGKDILSEGENCQSQWFFWVSLIGDVYSRFTEGLPLPGWEIC